MIGARCPFWSRHYEPLAATFVKCIIPRKRRLTQWIILGSKTRGGFWEGNCREVGAFQLLWRLGVRVKNRSSLSRGDTWARGGAARGVEQWKVESRKCGAGVRRGGRMRGWWYSPSGRHRTRAWARPASRAANYALRLGLWVEECLNCGGEFGGVFGLTFPYSEDAAAESLELAAVLSIAGCVALAFSGPVGRVLCWGFAAALAGVHVSEAAVDDEIVKARDRPLGRCGCGVSPRPEDTGRRKQSGCFCAGVECMGRD